MREHSAFRAVRLMSTAIALFLLSAAPGHGQAPTFTKTVKKLNGVVVTAQPASLKNGDVLDWMITYQFTPNQNQAAQADIKDLLSATLEYVPGSLQVPPSWDRQWFDGSTWVSSEPASPSGVGAVIRFPRLTPLGTGQTALLPAPPVASVNTLGGGGDGYRAIPYNGNVYVINHHSRATYLDCFAVLTGARCAGYPVHVPVVKGSSFTLSSNADNVTPGKTYEYLDRVTGKLYFAVEKINPTPPHDLGILCADLVSRQSCGFYGVAAYSASDHQGFQDYEGFQGMGGVDGKVYMQLPKGEIGCLDISVTTPTPCAGQPYVVASTSFARQYDDSSEIIGKKIYSTWNTGAVTGTAFILTCFDTTVNTPCVGWGPKTPDPTGTRAILYRLLAASGTVTGICAHTTNGPSTPPGFKCYDLSTGAEVGYPASYLAWVQTFSGGYYEISGYGQPGYYLTRVFDQSCSLPRNTATVTCAASKMGCYDFAISASCAEPAWPLSTVPLPTRHYATIADPERPGCMWAYGDDGLLASFAAADGSSCGGTTTLDTIVSPLNSYCAGGDATAWDKLSVTGLALGGGVTATLTLYDGSNPASLAVKANGNPFAKNLSVASLPLALGNSGLGIGYGTGPGQYKSLRVVLQFKGVTNHTPWTNTPPPSVEVSWLGGPPQFCFQTKVATCSSAAVTNQATAATTPATGAPFSSAAPQPPFSAAHVLGTECPAPIDPCCPPWNPDRLAEMMFYKGSGSISAPYTLNFQPTASFKSQIQAYIDYLHAVNPAIQKITIDWRLHDQGTGNTPTIPLGPQVNVTAYTTWTAGGNGTPTIAGDPNFFSLPNAYPMVIGTWYRVHTGIYLENGEVFFGDRCGNNEIWVRVQVLTKADRGQGPVLEFWNWSTVMRRISLGAHSQ